MAISRLYPFPPATGRRNWWRPVPESSFLFMRSRLATPDVYLVVEASRSVPQKEPESGGSELLKLCSVLRG